jgi:hypothetical protein
MQIIGGRGRQDLAPRFSWLSATYVIVETSLLMTASRANKSLELDVTEPPNYDDPHVPAIVIMTSYSRTYVPHNLKGIFSSE